MCPMCVCVWREREGGRDREIEDEKGEGTSNKLV